MLRTWSASFARSSPSVFNSLVSTKCTRGTLIPSASAMSRKELPPLRSARIRNRRSALRNILLLVLHGTRILPRILLRCKRLRFRTLERIARADEPVAITLRLAARATGRYVRTEQAR